MGKFCKQCGTPITPGNRFCDECGTPVGETPYIQTQPPPQPGHQDPDPPVVQTVSQPAAGTHRVPVPYIVGAVVVVVAVLAAVFLLPGLMPGQPVGTGTSKGTKTSPPATASAINPKYIAGDILKDPDGTLRIIRDVDREEQEYGLSLLIGKNSKGLYSAYYEIYVDPTYWSFSSIEAEYPARVDHTDQDKVQYERIFNGEQTPRYAVGDVFKDNDGLLWVIKEVDTNYDLYSYTIIDRNSDGSYSAYNKIWKRPVHTTFDTFEADDLTRVGHIDPRNVAINT